MHTELFSLERRNNSKQSVLWEKNILSLFYVKQKHQMFMQIYTKISFTDKNNTTANRTNELNKKKNNKKKLKKKLVTLLDHMRAAVVSEMHAVLFVVLNYFNWNFNILILKKNIICCMVIGMFGCR